ncbi:hypothetical protein NM208_g14875 [Fusarium decemcellulare]|uniref:Uncharacterized protein n=1 Tax=Fusarium decemcellulare TaxID=57161 RepID=A0ACC1RF60_9HYPO|nr:hypothetical protein NM208_g14875 [Fusarium decemcellulare]
MKDDAPEQPDQPEQPNPLSLAPPPLSLTPGGSRLEGSPLKNVIMPSPSAELSEETLMKDAISTNPTTEQQPAPASDEEKLLKAAIDAPFEADNHEPAPATDEEMLVQAAINAPFEAGPVPPQLPLVAEATETTDSTVAEPPSTVVGEAPAAAIERDVPMLEPTENEALLPPPPEQVGNIATTPSEPSVSAPGSDIRPVTEGQSGEDSIPERPPFEQSITGLTEDTIKPDDSASVTAPMSEVAEVPAAAPPSFEEPPPEPPAETTIQEPAEPVIEEPKPVSPPQPEVKEEAPASIEEPDLLGGLLGELDRQSEQKESEIPVSAPAPEPIVEAPSEPPTLSEPPALPEPEPVPESAPEPPPEPALIPSEPPAGPVEELTVMEETKPEETKAEEPMPAPVPEAPVVEAPVVEAPAAEAPTVEAPTVEAPVVEAPVVPEPSAEQKTEG